MPHTIADLIEARFGLPATAGRDQPAEGALATILAHRSCRRFQPQPVDESLIDIALAAALSAPAKSDLQQVAIVRVRDAAKRAEIGQLIRGLPWVATAPVLFIFCGDNRRMRRIAELRGKPFPNDTLDMFMNAAVDTGLVLQNFITGAEALGLGCCPISVVRNHVERITALLELPECVFPVAGLAVGHPATEGRISMRLPPALTVHTDRYDDSAFEREIEAYDRRRAAREPTKPEKQRRVDVYGVVEPYGWSEDKARQYSVPERHSFGPHIRGHGFGLE